MNPWTPTILDLLRNILRFAVWVCVMTIGLMAAIFSICFVYEFLAHLWTWCRRCLFTGGW